MKNYSYLCIRFEKERKKVMIDSTLVQQVMNTQSAQELAHAATAYVYFEIIAGVVVLIIFIVMLSKFFNN